MEWLNNIGKKFIKAIDWLRLTMKKKRFVDEDILVGVDIDLDELYTNPQVAKDLENRYLQAIKELDLLKPKYKETVSQIAILQRIENLSLRAKQELEKLCQVYSETLVKKSEYKEKIKEHNTKRSDDYLVEYEQSIEKIIGIMEEHENNQRMVKQDLAYLESEKAELQYQNKRYNSALSFVKGAMIGIAVLTAIAGFVLSVMLFVYSKPILLTAMISLIGVIAGTVWVYVFRRYLIYEIKKNQKLMKRAVELTNKTKIKYINNQKVIDFQCGKYKVDSSEMLRLRWENYSNKMMTERQYKNISNSIAAMITDIEDLLNKNGIQDDGFVLDYMDYFTSKKGRKILAQRLGNKKEELFKTLKHAEKESQVLNLVLTNYKSQGGKNVF